MALLSKGILKFSMVIFLFAFMRTSSSEAKVYKVGDEVGWTILDNPNYYSSWSSSKIFEVGDSLVFEYNKEFDNIVLQVSRDDYHTCNTKSPIKTYDSGKDTITISRKGSYFFIGGTPGHCLAGQKVDIRVPNEVYEVGGETGWTSSGNVNYASWTSSKKFNVGDKLVFKYNKEFDNVMQVSRDDYHSCNTNYPIKTYNSGNDTITIKRRGHYFFIGGETAHCAAGQKVDIRIPHKVYMVGDKARWTNSGIVNYTTWASSRNFKIGDTIVFEYDKRFYNVMQVSKEDYHSCNMTSPIRTFESGRDVIDIKAEGHHFYICGIPGHCAGSQKVNIRVSETSPPPNSSGAPARKGLRPALAFAVAAAVLSYI